MFHRFPTGWWEVIDDFKSIIIEQEDEDEEVPNLFEERKDDVNAFQDY